MTALFTLASKAEISALFLTYSSVECSSSSCSMRLWSWSCNSLRNLALDCWKRSVTAASASGFNAPWRKIKQQNPANVLFQQYNMLIEKFHGQWNLYCSLDITALRNSADGKHTSCYVMLRYVMLRYVTLRYVLAVYKRGRKTTLHSGQRGRGEGAWTHKYGALSTRRQCLFL